MLKTLLSHDTQNGPLAGGDENTVVLIVSPGTSSIAFPDAHLLFNADFTRDSRDLILTGDDGNQIIVRDYFASDVQADLVSPDGAVLTFETVRLLAGPLAPGQYAQASAPVAGEAIGKIVTGEVAVERLDGTTDTLGVGDTVFRGDVLRTGAGGGAGVVFSDETVFSLSPNARIVLNELVYQEGSNDNSMAFSLVQGTFSFVAGKIAPSGAMNVETPVATIGIRGTTVFTQISANDGTTVFRILQDPGTGRVGSYVLLDRFGNVAAVVDDVNTQFLLRGGVDCRPGSSLVDGCTPLPQPVPEGGDDQQTIIDVYNAAVRAGFIKAELEGQDNSVPDRSGGNDGGDSTVVTATALADLGTSATVLADQGLSVVALAEDLSLAEVQIDMITEPLVVSSNSSVSAVSEAAALPADGGVNPPDFSPDDGVDSPPVVPPKALDGAVSEDSDGRVITEDELLAGASDPEGLTLSVLSVSVSPVQGSISDNGDGSWTFTPAPDFSGTAVLTVVITDGENSTSSVVSLEIASLPDSPVITSNGGGATAAVNVAENGTAVTTVTASDADPGTVFSYSIVGGADRSLFTINETTGVLSFVSAPNFEAPADAGGNNVYDVTVQVSDGSLTATQVIAVTVTNANDGTGAVIGDPTVSAVTEDVGVVGGNLVAAGTISISDPDAGENAFQTSVQGQQGNLGALVLASDGSYTYTVANAATQSLGLGDTHIDTFTITSVDGTTKQISFTINGANDGCSDW